MIPHWLKYVRKRETTKRKQRKMNKKEKVVEDERERKVKRGWGDGWRKKGKVYSTKYNERMPKSELPNE